MSGIPGSRTGHVHASLVDDEPARTEALSAAVTEDTVVLDGMLPALDGIRVPRVRVARGTDHAGRPVEDGR